MASQKNMDMPFSHYYDVLRKVSSFVGIWPYLKPRTKFLRLTVQLIALLNLMVPQLAFQYMCKMELKCTAESFTSYTLTILVMIMLYTYQSNSSTIKLLTEHLFADWKELQSPKEYEIMKSYAAKARSFSLSYTVYCLVTVNIYISISLIPFILDVVLPLNESRPLHSPYAAYYFVDFRDHFFQIFVHSLVAWEFSVFGHINQNIMFVTFIEHICSLFSVVGYRFECLSSNRKAGTERIFSDDEYCEKLASLTNVHQRIIDMIQDLEQIFSVPFIADISMMTVGVSMMLLQMSQENTMLEMFKFLMIILVELTHLFLLSFEGQKLIDHSLQISNNIYKSSWYNISAKSQKLITIVMLRALRPSFLRAGKIYILSLQSFVSVIQTAMSYFAMLSSIQ